MISPITDQLAFCLFYQNHFNVFYTNKYTAILNICFQNIMEDFEKNSAPNIHYQQCLKNGKKVLDNGGIYGALLVDLSRAFDLSLAKLSVYVFDYNSIKLINSFLSGRKFRMKMKIGSSYSPYFDLLVGVSEGSILGPLLFNVYMCDCEINVINYPDGTTFYACEPNM